MNLEISAAVEPQCNACADVHLARLVSMLADGKLYLEGYTLHYNGAGIFLKDLDEAKTLRKLSLIDIPKNINLDNIARAMFSPVGYEAMACVIALHQTFPDGLTGKQVLEARNATRSVVLRAVKLASVENKRCRKQKAKPHYH